MNQTKETGYIKLRQDMLDRPWFTDPKVTPFFVYCLLKAEGEACIFETHGKRRFVLGAGEFVFSIKRAVNETGLSADEISTAIATLVEDGCIRRKPNKSPIITVIDYGRFLDDEQDSFTPIESLPPIPASLNAVEFLQAWVDWLSFHEQIEKPLASMTMERQLAKLEKMAAGDAAKAAKIIQHSISLLRTGPFWVEEA